MKSDEELKKTSSNEIYRNTKYDLVTMYKTSTIKFSALNGLPRSIFSAVQFYSYLQIYLCTAIFANLGLLFWDGNGGDIGYWEDWVKQLSEKGYRDFNGNYPPVYIHWLYVVGRIYDHLALPIENNIFLKFLTQIPILITHLLLITIIYKLLKSYSKSQIHFHIAMIFTTLNPAIFFNGAIWGQIDIIPVAPVLLAIICSTHFRYRIYTFPLYTLAILTKFQMIAFAPVMGVIFFRHHKIHLISSAIVLLIIVVAFLPFLATGTFYQSFKLAYVDVLHQYSATTMGAANIWILLTGNAAPDHLILFDIAPDSLLAPIFKAKNFGMICFILICLSVFIQGIRKLVNNQLALRNPQNIETLLFYSMVCTAAFFTFLPAMHERYLLPTVVIALGYYAVQPKGIIYPTIFSFISAFNLAMCLGLKTSSVWPAISWITIVIFLYAFLELIQGKKLVSYLNNLFFKCSQFKYLTTVVLIISLIYMSIRLYNEVNIQQPDLGKNQIFLTQLPIQKSHQDYGQLRINQSVNGTHLKADNRRYAIGIGTHANSTIEYRIPENSARLDILAALDDEVESASVKFYIWGNDKLLWESRPHYGAETPEKASINLEGITHLRLQVDGLNGIGGDHADWLNPILTVRKNNNN